jgi:hypothetical protein
MPTQSIGATDEIPGRCVIVVDETLAPGLAANAAAVLAVTLGARVPALIGAAFRDADGDEHPGLIDRGLPILRAPGAGLPDLRARALAAALTVIDMPTFGQQTNDYDTFRGQVGETATAELRYLGILVCGPKRAVNRVTGSLALLR